MLHPRCWLESQLGLDSISLFLATLCSNLPKEPDLNDSETLRKIRNNNEMFENKGKLFPWQFQSKIPKII